MMQFISHANEEPSVIKRKNLSDWRQTIITMHFTSNSKQDDHQAYQFIVYHREQEEKDTNFREEAETEKEGTYQCLRNGNHYQSV